MLFGLLPLAEALQNAIDLEPQLLAKRFEPDGENHFQFVLRLSASLVPSEREPTPAAAIMEFASTLGQWKSEVGYALREVAIAKRGTPARVAVQELVSEIDWLFKEACTCSFSDSIAPCLAFVAARHFEDSMAVYTTVNRRLQNSMQIIKQSVGKAVEALDATYIDVDFPEVHRTPPTSVFVLAGDDILSLATLAKVTREETNLAKLETTLTRQLDNLDPCHLLVVCSPNPLPTSSYRLFMKSLRQRIVFFVRKPMLESFATALACVCLSDALKHHHEDLIHECCRCTAFQIPPLKRHESKGAIHRLVMLAHACLDGVDLVDAHALYSMVKTMLHEHGDENNFALARFSVLCASSRTHTGVSISCSVPLDLSAPVVELYARSPSGLLLPSLSTAQVVEALSSLIARQLDSGVEVLQKAARRFLFVSEDSFAPIWKGALRDLHSKLNVNLNKIVSPLGDMTDKQIANLRVGLKEAVRDAVQCRVSVDKNRAAALVLWLFNDATKTKTLFARRFASLNDTDPFCIVSDFEDELRRAMLNDCRVCTPEETGMHRFDHPALDERTRNVLIPARESPNCAFLCSPELVAASRRHFSSVVFWVEISV